VTPLFRRAEARPRQGRTCPFEAQKAKLGTGGICPNESSTLKISVTTGHHHPEDTGEATEKKGPRLTVAEQELSSGVFQNEKTHGSPQSKAAEKRRRMRKT